MSTVLIDQDRCKGCRLCINACPRRLLAVSREPNLKGQHTAVVLDAARCTGCALCAEMCPDVAITVEK